MPFPVVFGFELFRKFVLSIVVASFWFPQFAGASQTVTLGLNPSFDPTVAGCRLYFGQQSHVYTSMVDAGNAVQVTITLPISGGTYYLAATTYDAAGDESGFSGEVVINPVSSPNVTVLSNPSIQTHGWFGFSVSGTNGNAYAVQASTNLTDWISLQTNVVPFSFVDTNAPNFCRRFYRAIAL